jgi:hypothetical protein
MGKKDIEEKERKGKKRKGIDKQREEDKRTGNSRLPCRPQTRGYSEKNTHRMPMETTADIDQWALET